MDCRQLGDQSQHHSRWFPVRQKCPHLELALASPGSFALTADQPE
jgi:hypothetical protein